MSYAFAALEPELKSWLARCKITRPDVVHARVDSILAHQPTILDQYLAAEKASGVPAAVLFALNERESSSNMHTYLGNGDPLSRPTRHVPAHRGPFNTWAEGAADALHLDHLDQVAKRPGGWTWPMAVFEEELWNGFGPRAHGRVSGYPWSYTNIYQGGKYVADGVWSASTWDTQIGTVPLMLALIERHPELALDSHPEKIDAPPPTTVAPAPTGSVHDTKWLQTALNGLLGSSLVVDGSYGRNTARVVRAFQKDNGLNVDGIFGPVTEKALVAALAKKVA